MSSLIIQSGTLSDIADAIRAKTGKAASMTPLEMPTEISSISGGGGTKPDIVLTGDQRYRFTGSNGADLVNAANYTTQDLTGSQYMFQNYTGTTIPFSINYKANLQSPFIQGTFDNSQITTLPTINFNGLSTNSNGGLNGCFQYCAYLSSIPDGTFSTFNFNSLQSATGSFVQYIFRGCSRLTHIDNILLPNLYTQRNNTNVYQDLFLNCYSLTDLLNVGLFHPTATINKNQFANTFYRCGSLSRLTFAANGAVRNYSNQSINLNYEVGYSTQSTVQQMPSFTGGTTLADSVYNHASAVETINSLPDCSAVSPPSAPTNRIFFSAGAGANTAGGSISDLTAEEIAVATNKGWIVSIN